ncbi:hypothetical protein U875_09595 [Pandoraea pnomenusa 3kgm]|uniref:hypothetical protein n=1 Tax=Pandoraea pnomenusa TaxID=93220 RepID=UPI0003C74904|nr:hypothetical protein [Pandoraea pnomenusa]AHB08385.1 hypothetical protein U875_09595 [Pandoraea pnomenusa 3kgm]
MKDCLLDSMDKGEWYGRQALADICGVSRNLVNRLVVELVNEGLLVIRQESRGLKFGLAVTRSTASVEAVAPVQRAKVAPRAARPSIATGPYRPKWKPMKAYDRYVHSHQQLCEEMR